MVPELGITITKESWLSNGNGKREVRFSTHSYVCRIYLFLSPYNQNIQSSPFNMNNAYDFDEYGNIMPSKQSNPSSNRAPQYKGPQWRQESGPSHPSFPPLNKIRSEASYRPRMAPPMDRHANRSRSPLNMERRPRDYRSRTPPSQQYSTSFDTSSRPYISYPPPLYPNRDGSPSRTALHRVSPNLTQSDRSNPAESRLLYPTNESRPHLRVSPVSHLAPPTQEPIPSQPSSSRYHTTERSKSAGPISDITKDFLLPYSNSGPQTDLIPRPLNIRSNPINTRKNTTSMCEYLSLDELENLWQSQDLYGGTITTPATTPCRPLYQMAPISPIPPSLADHPAFRNEHRQYNSSACV